MSLQYIIDGYNLINHPVFPRTNRQADNPPLLLLSFIRQRKLTGSLKNKVILVFDGYPPAACANQEISDATIIFSHKISADEKIKRLVEESAQRKSICVVSNDKEIKFMVSSLGAQALTIEDFVGAKEKTAKEPKKNEPLKQDLNYSQIDAINKELGKLWLK